MIIWRYQTGTLDCARAISVPGHEKSLVIFIYRDEQPEATSESVLQDMGTVPEGGIGICVAEPMSCLAYPKTGIDMRFKLSLGNFDYINIKYI